jgi:hypothetical protein
MKTKSVLNAVFWALVGAAVSYAVLKGHARFGRAVSSNPSSVHQPTPPVASTPTDLTTRPSLGSFEDRLKQALSQSPSVALLLEWFEQDRAAVMRYLEANRFRDARLPGLADAIGKTTSARELLDIANNAESPSMVLEDIGKWASPDVIRAFAALMPSVSVSAANETADAIGNLLAKLDVESARAFAMNLPTAEQQSYALVGLFEQLRDTSMGGTEILSVFNSLPPSVQAIGRVQFYNVLQLGATDPAAALQALNSMPADYFKTLTSLVLANNVKNISPETAIAALYQSGLSGNGVWNKVGPILQNWYASDPQGALNFLQNTQIIPPSDKGNYSSYLGGGKG